jgi:hypothetical protein
MIVIDLPADLNMEDDDGRNVARLPSRESFDKGAVKVAGFPGFWSWAVIDEVSDNLVYFHRVSAAEASTLAELAVSAPKG